MQEFKALSYIRKYRVGIILLSILLALLFYSFCSGMQTYTASAIILYKNEDAAEGLAADGTELDTSEIYSSEVMTKVFQELKLSYDEYNMDEIRAGITVEPMLTEEEITMQEALNAEGETLPDEPTRYLVSYTVKRDAVSDAEKFAGNLLKSMLDAYVETYAENHVNGSVSLISVEGIYDKDYDYIEMAEILMESTQTLYNQIEGRSILSFRSSETGYSYADLCREYNLLNEIDIPNVYAYILNNRITKDQDVLLAKYENRIETAKIKNDISDSEADALQEIMDTYAKMIKEATNAYTTTKQLTGTESGGLTTEDVTEDITYQYILDEVYNNYWKDYTQSGGEEGDNSDAWYEGDQTTEYDTLISRYVGERTQLEETLVDIAYYEYMIDVYSGRVNDENGILVNTEAEAEENMAAEGASETAVEMASGNEMSEAAEYTEGEESSGDEEETEDAASGEKENQTEEDAGFTTIESSEKEKNTAYQMIKELTGKLDSLNRATVLTNQEYNRYAGAENIAVMTDVVTAPAINLLLYCGIAFVLFLGGGCVLAIVGGRVAEIFEYYVYMDRKLELPNRAACDRYIGGYMNKLLTSDFACIVIKMRRIETLNKQYGRDKCDAMLSDFGNFLRDIFPSEKAFTAVNALGQFVIFMKDTDKTEIHAYIRELMDRCTGYNKGNECKIAYTCGIAISGEDEIYDIRKLMAHAVKISSVVSTDKKLSGDDIDGSQT